MPSKASQRLSEQIKHGVTPMYQLMCKSLLAALLVALPGCSSTVKYVRELPPQELLGDCPVVLESYKTNGDLVWTILEYRKALATCNLDKENLREWAKLDG